MQSSGLASTVRVGNHALTEEEVAAGAPQRLPFVEKVDGVTAPVDPDGVFVKLTAPTRTTYTFSWPTVGEGDSGTLEQEETGRFFVDWTPADGEDGLWRWELKGEMLLGTSQGDQDVFFVKRPIAPGA